MEQNKFNEIMGSSDISAYKSLFAKSFQKLGLNGDNFEQTVRKGKLSTKSLSFQEGELYNLFGIDEKGVFGQDKKHLSELDSRIYTVHSSALLALQIFNWVGKGNSIKIDETEYNEVWFEVKNKVFDSPSHIDILLVSADDRKKLLFLESKFTEYLKGEPCYGISEKYRSFYDEALDMFNVGNGLQISDIYKDSKGKPVFDLFSVKGKTSHYCEGFKQVISHYIGLLRGPQDIKGKYSEIFEQAEQLELAEIVYKLDGDGFNNYSGLYSTIAKRLNSLTNEEIEKVPNLHKREGFVVREDILTYQKLLENNKDYKLGEKGENIKKFYQFDECGNIKFVK